MRQICTSLLIAVLLLSTKYCASSFTAPDAAQSPKNAAVLLKKSFIKDPLTQETAYDAWNNNGCNHGSTFSTGSQKTLPAATLRGCSGNDIYEFACRRLLKKLLENNTLIRRNKNMLLFPMHCFL